MESYNTRFQSGETSLCNEFGRLGLALITAVRQTWTVGKLQDWLDDFGLETAVFLYSKQKAITASRPRRRMASGDR